MIKLNASNRITALNIEAAEADQKQAMAYLTELGFKGLTPKSSKNQIIKFTFKTYNPKTLEKKLGKPKKDPADTGTGNVRYNVPGHGVVVVWPDANLVMIKNSKRNG